VASSNPGKVAEFRELAGRCAHPLRIDPLPDFDRLPTFEESAETFAENAAGKALHYSRGVSEYVLADDSGLVVPALGGEPGVRSSRYAGPECDAGRNIVKLLAALEGKTGAEREARFVCVLALARGGRALAVVSASVDGTTLEAPRGSGGFGYDPVFYYQAAGKTFAELPAGEKNRVSHRGRAFEKLAAFLGEAG
jgi:non-canonical purine NTP pyrophosphatase (RdgB/HAM1 family)